MAYFLEAGHFCDLKTVVTMATQMNCHSCVLVYPSATPPPNELPFPVCLYTPLLLHPQMNYYFLCACIPFCSPAPHIQLFSKWKNLVMRSELSNSGRDMCYSARRRRHQAFRPKARYEVQSSLPGGQRANSPIHRKGTSGKCVSFSFENSRL